MRGRTHCGGLWKVGQNGPRGRSYGPCGPSPDPKLPNHRRVWPVLETDHPDRPRGYMACTDTRAENRPAGARAKSTQHTHSRRAGHCLVLIRTSKRKVWSCCLDHKVQLIVIRCLWTVFQSSDIGTHRFTFLVRIIFALRAVVVDSYF